MSIDVEVAWRDTFAAMREQLAGLEEDGLRLLQRAIIPTHDGFKASTIMEGSTGGGAGDPTGNLVVGLLSPGTDAEGVQVRSAEDVPLEDPVARWVKAMMRHTAKAREELDRAGSARRRALEVQQVKPPGEPDHPCCVNCWRFDVESAIYKAGRCQACYVYKRRSAADLDAPESVVTSRPEVSGKRRRVRVESGGAHG